MVNGRTTKIENIFLFITGATMPLITIRMDAGFYSITAYMLSLLVLYVYSSIKTKRGRKTLIYVNVQEVIIFVFLFAYCFSLLYSPNLTFGFSKFVKLCIVVMYYFMVEKMITQNPVYLDCIIKYAIITLPIYISYLVYRYLFVFNASYLGINTQYATRTGKNSLAFMMSILIPFTICELFGNKSKTIKKYIMSALHIVALVSVILIQSRGLFLTTILYLVLNYAIEAKKVILLLRSVAISLIIVILLIVLVPDAFKEAIVVRYSGLIYTIRQEQDISELSSERYALIERGIDLFSINPLIGVGAGGFIYYGGGESLISHNDYILVLTEQGLIGFTPFILLIISFVFLSYKNFRNDRTQVNKGLFLGMCGITFYLLLINAYDNILLWSLFAFISAVNNIKKRDSLIK